MYKLFIDDERFPVTSDYIIVRSYDEAIQYMTEHWCGDFITFDHDLGEGLSWDDICKWIIERDIYQRWHFIPDNFSFDVHSMNPIWRKNIKDRLNRYLQYKREWK